MRVALTIWEGRISPVFDVCREVMILDVVNEQIVSTVKESLDTPTDSQKVEKLIALAVELLICGAISAPLHQELLVAKIKTYAFVSGEITEVIQALLSGELPSAQHSMPGCSRVQAQPRQRCGQGRRHHGGRNQNQRSPHKEK